MIKAVIIDDELPSIETLKWKLENYCQDVQVIVSFDDPSTAINYLKQSPPDLVFLDVEMPLLTGFDVLEEIGKPYPFEVIFTTAYDQFGIAALKASALDYLLKPVQNKELKEAIEKFRQKTGRPAQADQRNEVPAATRTGRIALASKESIEFVQAEEIIVCIASSNYTTVYLSDGRKKVISKTLKEFEELLVPFQFFRPHNSHLVNLRFVKEFIRGDGGYLVLHNTMKIPVSKGKREELLHLLS